MVDIKALQQYVQRYPEILGKLFNGETVLSHFVPHTGANPGKYALRLYNAGGELDECCKVPEGDSSFEEVETIVECFTSGNEFCGPDLAKVLTDLQFRFTAGNESAPAVEEIITDQELKAIAKNIDRLVFQGDTESEDKNLNRFDGLLKQAGDKEVDLSAIESAYDKVYELIANVEDEAEDMDQIAIYVPYSFSRKLKGELIAKNLFHYDPGMGTEKDQFNMPGYDNFVIIPTRGLNGVDKIFASPKNNLHWVTNLENDHMNMLWDFDNYKQIYFWRVNFILGVTIGIKDYVMVGKLK